jgi:integrase/recombinase XerD
MLQSTHSGTAKRVAREWFSASIFNASADTYVQYLAERGYATQTVEGYFRSAAHFAHWSEGQRVRLIDFNKALIHRFVNEHLPDCRCTLPCRLSPTMARAALGHLLTMLTADGQCAPEPTTSSEAITAELAFFDRHLNDVCGLAPVTRLNRMHHLRHFLSHCFGNDPVQMSALGVVDVHLFIANYSAKWLPASIRTLTTSLRSYFAFRGSKGDLTAHLVAALPQVAQWRMAGLPQQLTSDEITRLLGAFDRCRATGQRDYAITRCLLDLGLRRMEVARLQLDDIDWRAGTLSVHSKGKRIDILPLPDTCGRAIVQYLQEGRPPTTRRELFVRHRPPINAPAGPDIVRNAVRYAAKRCGLEQRINGTHILRHTLAARLVQGGARFKEIADLLRHRNLNTTTIYAKVDLPALARVALPWPGRQL